MLQKYNRVCVKCQCSKPPRCHHCSVCGRCVMMMDHHCPWMNNCVGQRNLKAFLLFNAYTVIAATYSAVRSCIEIGFCLTSEAECFTYTSVTWIGIGITLIIMCVLFAFFTTCMFTDQIRMRMEETSTIDKKQIERQKLKNPDYKVPIKDQGKGIL